MESERVSTSGGAEVRHRPENNNGGNYKRQKLLKTLICLEKQTPEQIPDQYKKHQKHLSTKFGVVLLTTRLSSRKPYEEQSSHYNTKDMRPIIRCQHPQIRSGARN